MTDILDLLQIKIEKARAELPEETLNAISAVDWKATILSMRASKGYNFEQLGELEIQTELLLCGLLPAEDYPRELEKGMGISKMAANELVSEMNILVFKKIKEELIKNSERKKIFANRSNATITREAFASPTTSPYKTPEPPPINKVDAEVFKSAGIEVVKPPSINEKNNTPEKPLEKREDLIKKVENPDAVHPILGQKLGGLVQMPTVKTEYSIENISKPSDRTTVSEIKSEPNNKIPSLNKADPYRLSPDE